ncbi:hypothetical protein ACI65C_006464, partial [Semiaphis heraclei]
IVAPQHIGYTFIKKSPLYDSPIKSTKLGSFKEAKEKARRAQITSDLSSADEQPKRNADNDADDSDKTFSPHANHDYGSDTEKVINTNIHDQNDFIEWLTDDLVGNTDSSSVVMPVTPTKNIASTSALTEMKCPDDITSNNPISFSIAIPPVTPTSVINHCNYNLYFLDDFQKFVKTSLTNMVYEIKSMAYSIEVLKSLTAQSIENATSNVSTEINTSYEIIWPVNNNDELTAIETLLNDQKIRNNQAIILSRSVGLTIPETVRRIMQRMFSDSFIQKYSYVGFKGKNKFSGLNCCKLLFDSIRKNKKFELLPDIDISSAVSKWMAQAGNLSSVEIAEPDKLSLLTPTKTYVKSRSDVVELVFPSPSSITSTPQKNKISKLIDMPSPSLKRKINYETDNDSPRKIKLKQSIKHKQIPVINVNKSKTIGNIAAESSNETSQTLKNFYESFSSTRPKKTHEPSTSKTIPSNQCRRYDLRGPVQFIKPRPSPQQKNPNKKTRGLFSLQQARGPVRPHFMHTPRAGTTSNKCFVITPNISHVPLVHVIRPFTVTATSTLTTTFVAFNPSITNINPMVNIPLIKAEGGTFVIGNNQIYQLVNSPPSQMRATANGSNNFIISVISPQTNEDEHLCDNTYNMCTPDPNGLWETYKDSLSENCLHRAGCASNNPELKKIVHLIEASIKLTKFEVEVGNATSKMVEVRSGLPILFNLVLEKFIREMNIGREGGVIMDRFCFSLLAYADNIGEIILGEEPKRNKKW